MVFPPIQLGKQAKQQFLAATMRGAHGLTHRDTWGSISCANFAVFVFFFRALFCFEMSWNLR